MYFVCHDKYKVNFQFQFNFMYMINFTSNNFQIGQKIARSSISKIQLSRVVAPLMRSVQFGVS
jgi:hypothetical protein